MLLRFEDPPAVDSEREFAPAWEVVEHVQKQPPEGAWLVTQPSHAALAGEIAAKGQWPEVAGVDAKVVQAIALHDAGWGPLDAQAVRALRSGKKDAVGASFLFTRPEDILRAWAGSVETAEKASPIGGFLVSRHFWRIGKMALNRTGVYPEPALAMLRKWLEQEAARQEKLARNALRTPAELEQLTDLLQFCDLASLYICCGARQPVEMMLGAKRFAVRRDEDGYRFTPSPFAAPVMLEFAAIRAEGARIVAVRLE